LTLSASAINFRRNADFFIKSGVFENGRYEKTQKWLRLPDLQTSSHAAKENVITVAATDRATFDEETFRFEVATASKEVQDLRNIFFGQL